MAYKIVDTEIKDIDAKMSQCAQELTALEQQLTYTIPSPKRHVRSQSMMHSTPLDLSMRTRSRQQINLQDSRGKQLRNAHMPVHESISNVPYSQYVPSTTIQSGGNMGTNRTPVMTQNVSTPKGSSGYRTMTPMPTFPPVDIPRTQTPDVRKPTKVITPATYDGTGSWLDYQSHFNACAAINNWSDVEKGLYLAVSLRGQAQVVLGNLQGEAAQRFDLLSGALEERFAPSNQTELYRVQLRERRQKASESLPELGQSIRRLTHLAYPTAPGDVKETLAKEQFIDALRDSEMRLRIKQSRPVNLNDAVRHAVELETFIKSDKHRFEGRDFARSIDDSPSQMPTTNTDTSTITSLCCEMQKAKVSEASHTIASLKECVGSEKELETATVPVSVAQCSLDRSVSNVSEAILTEGFDVDKKSTCDMGIQADIYQYTKTTKTVKVYNLDGHSVKNIQVETVSSITYGDPEEKE